MNEKNGEYISCAQCDGHGQVSSWSFGVKEPDECGACGGSGLNWKYSGGAVAKHYAGPMIGRLPPPKPINPNT